MGAVNRYFCLLVLSLLFFSVATAQEETRISIAVPITEEDLYQQLIDEFVAQNPSIQVDLITKPFSFGNDSLPDDPDEYLDYVFREVSKTDVVIVDPQVLTPETTRAGYFLDLTPLASVDASLDEFDFYDAMWRSYQWDGGLWALPFEGDVTMLFYQQRLFDDAGVLYPDPTWNLRDVESAIRDLTVYDENDNVEESAVIDATDNQALYAIMLSLLGHGIYDDLANPSFPRLDDPILDELLEIWADVQRDGLLGVNPGGFDAPMLLGPSTFAFVPQFARDYEVVVLPGGRPNVTVNAFAVSAGTENPQAAYELAKFLTFSEDLAQETNSIPARRYLAEDQGLGYERLDDNVIDAIQTSLQNALPVSEMRFTSMIGDAVQAMVLQNIDARTAINDAELAMVDRLQLASDRAGTEEIVVRGLRPVELQPGEIALHFGISSIVSPLPTQSRWDQVIEDFVANDFEVGHIYLEIQQNFLNLDLEDFSNTYDCFYLPDNKVPGANLGLIRSFNPLISTDPSFDATDFVGNVLDQVKREDQTWAIPLVIQPEVMFYNPDVFNRNGAFMPQGSWTVAEFEDALRTIHVAIDDPAAFIPQSLGGTYIQVLLASYGGLAVDYRTDPPTINFDDPAVVQAAQQVLDLAKDGYIQYDGLTENLGFNIFTSGTPAEIAIYNRLLNAIGDFIPGLGSREQDQLVTFPQGAQLNALAYDMGTVYISSNSLYSEACYRFISELSRTPDLFNEMPARKSQINSPQLEDEQGLDAANFYRALDSLLQQPTTVGIPTPLGLSIESADVFLATLWLNRAFDRYVFEDADLQLELQDAQQFATEFLACSDAIPLVNPNDEEAFGDYAQAVVNCATDVDPTFGDLLGL